MTWFAVMVPLLTVPRTTTRWPVERPVVEAEPMLTGMPVAVMMVPLPATMPSTLTRSFSEGIGSFTGSTAFAVMLVEPALKVDGSILTLTVMPSVTFVTVALEATDTVSGGPFGTGVSVKVLSGLPVAADTMPRT